MITNRIPIWLVEEEVGGGLPTERRYRHSAYGKPIGYIMMQEFMFMVVQRYAESIDLRFDDGTKRRSEYVASLSTYRMVQAALMGEFGLSWFPNPEY